MANNSFNTAGDFTWTCPQGVLSANIEIWGGGGGGGGGNATVGGSGGGGGAYARLDNYAVTGGANYNLTVGNAGANGGTNANGTAGQNSVFRHSNNANAAWAEGGKPGARGRNSAASFGAGGALGNSSGNATFSGGDGAVRNGTTGTQAGSGGGAGGTTANGTGGGNGLNAAGGAGGNAGGGNGGGANLATVGGPGVQPGGGGAGGGNANYAGGLGGVGRIFISWSDNYTIGPIADTASGGDAIPGLSASIPLIPDTGNASEALPVGVLIPLMQDTAIGSDGNGTASFPSVGVLDNFNRANQALNATGNWVEFTGLPVVADQRLKGNSANNENWARWIASNFNANQEVFLTVVTLAGYPPITAFNEGMSLFARTNNNASSNGYDCQYIQEGANNARIRIYRYKDGAFGNQIGNTYNFSAAPGFRFGMRCLGNNISGWYCPPSSNNWSCVIGPVEDTDPDLLHDGTPAIAGWGDVGVYDDLGCGEIGQGGANITVGAALSMNDTGAGQETLPALSAQVPITDSASGAESLNFDFGSAVAKLADIILRAVESGTLVSITDSGAASDLINAISAALNIPDSGNAVDIVLAPNVTLQTLIDSATGVDAAALQLAVSLLDAGIGVDALTSLLASLAVQETGSGTDALAAPSVSTSLTESASGTDALASILATLPTIPDTATGVDSAIQFILIQVAETGTGADAVTQVTVQAAISDTGSAADAVSQLRVTFTLADAGAFADLVNVQLPGIVNILETALGSDSIGAVRAALSVTDVSSATDTPAILVTLPLLADTSSAVDALVSVLKAFAVALTDTGAGADSLTSVSVQVPISETGAGVDLLTALTAVLSVVDSGAGVDTAVNLTLLGDYNKLTITFSGKKGGASFTSKKGRLTIVGKKGTTEFDA